MAAVRLRSSQNFLRASGLMATKPSPLRELARRTTSDVARATSSALSPAISPTNTILGKPPRLLLVAYPTALRYRSSRCSKPANTVLVRLCSANIKSLISTMLGTASLAFPKNSKHTVRVCSGMRCKIQRALVIKPSQPSFWMPGKPLKNLSVTSLPRPTLRKLCPGMSRCSCRTGVLPSASK